MLGMVVLFTILISAQFLVPDFDGLLDTNLLAVRRMHFTGATQHKRPLTIKIK